MRAFRLCAVALCATAMIVPLADSGHVSAASVTPVLITGFKAVPADGATITYGETQVTVSGQLAEYNHPAAGVPDEPVQIEFDTNTVVGTVTTDANGDFSTTVTLPKGGTVWAWFNGDPTSGYGVARTNPVAVNATPATTRIVLAPQPKPVVPAGTVLTFTGTAEVQVGGAWQPLPDAYIYLTLNGTRTGAGADTGADGGFTLQATETGGNDWQARLDAPGGQPVTLYSGTTSNSDLVNVSYRTRLASFSVPAIREAHQSFTVRGAAQVWNGSAWTGYAGLQVAYYYRLQGSSTWIKAGGAQTNAAGGFSGPASVRPGHTVWQVRVARLTVGTQFLPSASGTENSFITDRTCVTGLSISHSGGRTLVHARVQDWCANGQRSFGQVKGHLAKVYYHPRGTTAWRYLGETRTDAGGFVTFTRYSVVRGYFHVAFPAQGYYLASTSNSVYAG